MLLLLLAFLSVVPLVYTEEPNRKDIKELHVVISNHLDCGYTDLLVEVVNKYFDDYFPKIRKYGEELNALNVNISWVYTTQSWLISLYLECPPNIGFHCPSEIEKERLIDSIINKQELIWHSFPFNSQLETYDSSLIEYGTWLSMKYLPSILDNNPNIQIPTVLSQRDVPGMTRSMIPILKRNGVRAISIGCNEWSAAADTPNIFRWLDPVSNEEIITMIHAGNYGGFFPKDTVMIENYSEAIMFAWNGDNAGPFPFDELLSGFEGIKEEFPNAYVHGSTFDNYINNLLENPEIINSLPVIDKEIGDTWSYGIASDPLKLSKFRIASRYRSKYLKDRNYTMDDTSFAFNNFSRFLLKTGEHTWGINYGQLGSKNFTNNTWTNQQMTQAMMNNNTNQGINRVVYSWNEQRLFGIKYAMDALKLSSNKDDIDLYNDIMNEFDLISQPLSPLDTIDMNQYIKINNISSQIFNITIGDIEYNIKFNETTGALSSMINTKSNINYINNDGLGIFYYSTRTEQDFQKYWNDYTYRFYRVGDGYIECETDFCKTGLENSAPFVIHQNILSSLISIYKHKDNDVFIIEMDLGKYQNDLNTNYGAPQKIYNIINFTSIWYETKHISNNNGFSMQLFMISKQWTRIPENIWFVFNAQSCDTINVNKIGEMVDIQNIVRNGSWHLHSVDPSNKSVECMFNSNSMISMQSMDASLAGFIPKSNEFNNEFTTFPIPLNVSNDLGKGVGFALFDNTWNTNYPFWYPFNLQDVNLTYRFNIFLS